MFHQMPDRIALGVAPEQVVAVIESINAPNISVPGRGTGPTKAFIVGIRLPNGNFTVMLYMHLLELETAAIFAPDPQEVPLEHYPVLEGEAIQYVESMGFMLDNLNFRARSPEEQHRMTQTLPIFFDRPPPRTHTGGFPVGGFPAANASGAQPPTGVEHPLDAATPLAAGGQLTADEGWALARLLSAFVLLIGFVASSGCAHTPTPEEQQKADGSYQIALTFVHEARDLGVNGQGPDADLKWRQALGELQKGEKLDPENAAIQYMLGMVYFVGFHREKETEQHLLRALALKQGDYAEAQNLLGTALVEFGRPEEAIPHLEAARSNLLYETPYFAEQELGWALFKLERFDEAAAHLQTALAAQPDLCGAYVRLADVEEQRGDFGRVEEILGQFLARCDTDRLRASCGPRLLGYGYYRLGMTQMKLGQAEQAMASFETCRTRFPTEPVARECIKSLNVVAN